MENKILFIVLVFGIILINAGMISAEQELSCVQAAVLKREMTIASAYQNLMTEMGKAFELRTQTIIAGYGILDKKIRQATIKSAWKNYNDSYKVLKKELIETRKQAWKDFKSDRENCKVSKEMSDSESYELRL